MAEGKSSFIKTFDVFKKMVDVVDDAWNASRGFLPALIVNMVGAFLIAGVALIIHTGEAYEGICDFIEDFLDKRQRKVRLFTSTLGTMCTLSGIGLAATYVIAHLSAIGVIGSVAISSVTIALLPVLIPGLLLTKYCLYLGRKSYLLHNIKKEAEEAKKAYLESNDVSLSLVNRGINIYEKFTSYQNAYKKLLNAEKEAAFETLEVVASGMVVTGVALGSVATIGLALGAASFASFGVLPIVLLVTGVSIGVCTKVFEYIDNKYEGKYTKRLRSFFRNAFSLPDDEPTKIKLPDIEPKIKHIPPMLGLLPQQNVEVKVEPRPQSSQQVQIDAPSPKILGEYRALSRFPFQ